MPVINSQKGITGDARLSRPARILLVDENTRDLDHYRRMLHDCGFQVRPCADFKEAARLLDSGNFDCIVASQGGPRFEGRTVLERSVARDRYRPVVIICRHHSVACYIEAMQLGAVDYLEKPLSAREIKHAVTTHLQPRNAAA
ncbi:MAG TPA: response regulator [Terriglobia bacterium]|nr:response regulator [Terriglobia bacterium]